MPGLVPGIHDLGRTTSMAGTSPAMTKLNSGFETLRGGRGVLGQGPDQRAVDLEHVDREALEMLQGRITEAEVRQTKAQKESGAEAPLTAPLSKLVQLPVGRRTGSTDLTLPASFRSG